MLLMCYCPQIIAVLLSEVPFRGGYIWSGPEILDQPDEVPVAVLAEEFRPQI